MAVGTAAALAGGALLGSGILGGQKQAGTTTTTTNTAPWDVQQPYLRDLFGRAQAAVNTPYSGPRLTPSAVTALGDTINGKYLDPSSNPALQGAVSDALGQVRSSFAGQYGGAAGQNLDNSGYQEMLARTLANSALPIYANAYNQERQNQLQAAGLATSVDQANTVSPFSPLLAYQQLVGGNYGGTGTQQQPYFTNPMAGALGGALGVAGIGQAFPKLFS